MSMSGLRQVLVVDDEQAILDLLAEFFEGKGLRVWTASDLKGAMQILNELAGQLDILWTDLELKAVKGRTVESGRTLTEYIQDRNVSFPHTRVVVASGWDKEVVLDHLRSGKGGRVDEIVYKPYQFSDIWPRVESLLLAGART